MCVGEDGSEGVGDLVALIGYEANVQATLVGEFNEVIPYLRALKFTADEARQAAAHCETIPDAPLEERVRLALRSTHLRVTYHGPPRLVTGSWTTA